MTHEQKLASVRRWVAERKDLISLRALAERVGVAQSTLFRAVSEDPNQQRNVDAELLASIIKVLSFISFNPATNYVSRKSN